jgi:Zn-dependent peptidase ImmA (M78 family)
MLAREFYSHCENIASRLRYGLKLLAYDPLPARRLAAHMGIEVFMPSELPGLTEMDIVHAAESDGWSAITVLNNPPIIIAHPRHPPPEFESDMMHELAHVLLKHKPELLGQISAYRVARRYAKTQEYEADALGDCLQLPRAAIHYARQLNLANIQIVTRFCVSQQCIERRKSLV